MNVSSGWIFIQSVVAGMKYFEWMKDRYKFADLSYSSVRSHLV